MPWRHRLGRARAGWFLGVGIAVGFLGGAVRGACAAVLVRGVVGEVVPEGFEEAFVLVGIGVVWVGGPVELVLAEVLCCLATVAS